MNLSGKTDRLRSRLMSLFVALSLSVTWYYTISPFAMGTAGNGTNFWCFSAMSKSNYHMETLGVWRPRVAGLWITGQLLDSIVKEGPINIQDYQNHQIVVLNVTSQDSQGAVGHYFSIKDCQNVFGLYHACWLFVFFLVLIYFLENALFVILGCFAGLLYMLTPEAGGYSYAWDMPTIVFFTLGYFLWLRKQNNLMLAVIIVGSVFKETSAVLAILYFFTYFPIWKRIAYFVGAIASTFVVKMAVMMIFYGKFDLVTQDIHSGSPDAGFFASLTMVINIKRFFTPQWNHFIFTNAGTFIIALFLPMRTRNDIATKALLVVFFCAQVFAGSLKEFRDMLEALPIAVIYLNNYFNGPKTEPASALSPKEHPKAKPAHK